MPVGRGRATVDDERLVEMKVAFDQAGRHQAARRIQFLTLRRKARFEGGNNAVLDADIGERNHGERDLARKLGQTSTPIEP